MPARSLPLAALLLVTLAAPGAAHEGLHLEHAWARATPPGVAVGAVYLVITNPGSQPDRLVSAASQIADRAEIHSSSMDGELMTMRKLEELEIGPRESVALEPHRTHVMLMGLAHPLLEGERFPLVLSFEHAGDLEVEVEVTAAGAMAAPGTGQPHDLTE